MIPTVLADIAPSPVGMGAAFFIAVSVVLTSIALVGLLIVWIIKKIKNRNN